MISLIKIISEMPVFMKKGSKVVTPDNIELKQVNDNDLEKDNLVLYVNKGENPLIAIGWFMVWFYNEPGHGEKLSKGESEMLLFPIKFRYNFKSSPITDIWKKRMAGKNTDKIIGAIQGWVNEDKKTIYVNMISVRPGWKKNSVATKMMDAVKRQWSGFKLTVSKLTPDGEKFFSKDKDKIDIDTRDYNSI